MVMPVKYKALFTADWQLCNSLAHAKVMEHGETDRLDDQLKVLGKIGEIAKAEKVNGIYVLGDVFEKRLLDAITLRYGVEIVVELSEIAPVYLLPGNHDANSSRGERFLPEVFDVVGNKNVMYLDGSVVVRPAPKLPLEFFALPWCPATEAAERIASMRKKQVGKNLNVLLLHHSVKDCVDGGWQCDEGLDADEVCEGWDLVESGHFHERQKFGSCGEYVGAPMQHDFGDAGAAARGVRIVEFGESKISKSFKEIASPRFHIHEWERGTDTSRNMWTDQWSKGDYVRVDVKATHSEWKALLPLVDERVRAWRDAGLNVLSPKHVPIAQHEDRLGLEKAPSHSEVVEKFVAMANTEGLSKKRLIEIGKGILKEVRDV